MDKKVYTKKNFWLIIIGLVLIGVAYLLLYMKRDVDPNNFVSMYIVPVLMTLGYLVFIPLGLLYKSKKMGD